MEKVKTIGLSILSALAPMMVLAQVGERQVPPPPITSVGGLFLVMCQIVNYVFTIFLILGILFVIVAAFRYLTASGDPEKVKKANHTLIYAAVAILVAVMAKAIPLIVNSIVGGTGNIAACG